MVQGLLVLIIILWILGIVQIPFVNTVLFNILNHPVTVHDLLLLFLFVWVTGILPRPFREIAIVLLILWVFSILGILAITGLSNILVLAIIIGIILSIFNA